MSLLNGLFPIATDSEGRTIPNAYLYSYAAGTNTPKVTYSDSGLSVPNANPLQADGSGWFANVYLGAGGYKLVLRDENDVVIRTQDDYYQALDGTDLTNIDADIAALSAETAESICVYTDSGAADAYVLAPTSFSTAPGAYVSGMMIVFKPTNTNTGASTVNVSSLGLKNLVDQSGSALSAGFLETSKYYTFVYDTGAFRYMTRSGLVSTSVIVDDSVTLGKMAAGTAGNFIQYDSAGDPASIKSPLRLLTSGNLSATASLSFVLSTLDTSQSVDNSYLIRLIGIQPATDDVELWATISSDGGSTYLAGVGYYSCVNGTDSDNTARALPYAGAAQMGIMGAVGAAGSLSNAANETCSVDIFLTNFNTGTSLFPHVRIEGAYWLSAANIYASRRGGGSNNAGAADFDAIKLTWEGGANFAAVGKYYIYKIPNAT